ncbi:hypothetical protein [Halorhabdus sp. CUG00001]|uniref:hypothetical protein n=1 Tax=Halorhabdus sp. CUG00001 TaxID=2600297 RepID=UPI0018EF1578|nr:hypothetical protein [Halorhabdus sp. CUG00001]
MSSRLVPLLVVVGIVAIAGCATTSAPTTQTPTATTTATPTATPTTAAPTATPATTETATTTSEPTTILDGDDAPVVLTNNDDERHTLRVSVTNESAVLFNETVTVEADAEQTIVTLQGPETTYRVQAALDGQSIDENVTLYPGFVESQIGIDDDGDLEYTTLVN